MNEDEYKREKRRQRALERLGTTKPKCIYCEESDPHCLELHHLPDRTYGDDTVIVCRNHHRKLSNMQKGHPKQIGSPPDPLECIAHFLLCLADFFELLIEKLRESGDKLISEVSVRSESQGCDNE